MFPNCPICGDELLGTVEATWTSVPLNEAGYSVSEGKAQANEIIAVQCPNCGWEGPGQYYYTGSNRPTTQ